MGTLNAFFCDHTELPLRTSHHLSRAICLVNRRLESAEALTDSSLAVVNFLLVQELVREARLGAEIHMKGLQKMVELRGGIDQIKDHILLLKICKYVVPCRRLRKLLMLQYLELTWTLHCTTALHRAFIGIASPRSQSRWPPRTPS
jgi:hypothetical protein